jgi:hypothetical protein
VHWDGIEYWDPARKRGVLFAFHGSTAEEPDHRFVLAGLKPEVHYRLRFADGSAPETEATGKDLMGSGLAVHLDQPYSSELVFLQEASVNGSQSNDSKTGEER